MSWLPEVLQETLDTVSGMTTRTARVHRGADSRREDPTSCGRAGVSFDEASYRYRV